MMSRTFGRIPLLALLCVTPSQGCDTFTYAVVDNQTGAPIDLEVSSSETFEWWLAGLMGAAFAYQSILPPVIVSILAFPIVAGLVSRVDRWRLGR